MTEDIKGLVKRLRDPYRMGRGNFDVMVSEAADAIEALAGEVERLRGVLDRLASDEAFHHSHVLVARDAELVMRMDFARKALEGTT